MAKAKAGYDIYTYSEVAEIIGKDYQEVYRAVHRGIVEPLQTSPTSQKLFTTDHVEELRQYFLAKDRMAERWKKKNPSITDKHDKEMEAFGKRCAAKAAEIAKEKKEYQTKLNAEKDKVQLAIAEQAKRQAQQFGRVDK